MHLTYSEEAPCQGSELRSPGILAQRYKEGTESQGRVWSGQTSWLPAKGPSMGQELVESTSVQGRVPSFTGPGTQPGQFVGVNWLPES